MCVSSIFSVHPCLDHLVLFRSVCLSLSLHFPALSHLISSLPLLIIPHLSHHMLFPPCYIMSHHMLFPPCHIMPHHIFPLVCSYVNPSLSHHMLFPTSLISYYAPICYSLSTPVIWSHLACVHALPVHYSWSTKPLGLTQDAILFWKKGHLPMQLLTDPFVD